MTINPTLSKKQRAEKQTFSHTTELEKGVAAAVNQSILSVQEKLYKLLGRFDKEKVTKALD